MKRIVILGFDGALSTAITGVCDLMSLAGVTWNLIHNQPRERLFSVLLATPQRKPIRCSNGIELSGHVALEDDWQADVVLVPTIAAEISATLHWHPEVVARLQRAHQEKVTLGSNCTGAFFLAEAGLLDGKQATTHWGFATQFSLRYPKVQVLPEQLVTQDDNIYCAGGGLAWFDLGLHLIEKFYGRPVALQTAKAFVIDFGRESQLSYSPVNSRKHHQDELVLQIQNWLENHYSQSVSLDTLATTYNLTSRTLVRRFKKATGTTALDYLQSVRLEAAQKNLEESSLSIEQITENVGYEDVSSFIRLFKRKTGLTPAVYRRKFGR